MTEFCTEDDFDSKDFWKRPVKIKRVNLGVNYPLPFYATSLSAGMDLVAAIPEPITLVPGERRLVPTGIALELEEGIEAQIRPRSGLALKHGITVLNAPGTIDADYRGEVGVILANLSGYAGPQFTNTSLMSDKVVEAFPGVPFVVEPGMRIAQMVITYHECVKWVEVSSLSDSARGDGGFGHTGS